ncbi:MAG: hypothetical protein KIT33_14645 [Candidatus Kapabacteria bacterium]|nr:hypothetical protein [Ignavibacteriota bacterium]MCW5886206.1 hypothetical protein [Candidatus Kapabacteria bacterium]
MKKYLILIILLSTYYYSFSDWKLTGWRSEPDIKKVFPLGDTIIIVDEEPKISFDKGNTWKLLSDGTNKYNIISAFVLNNTVYLSSISVGLILSTDLGKTWMPRNNGLPMYGISEIFTDGNNLYGTVSGSIDSGVYISTDLGNTWTLKNRGLPNGRDLMINTIAFLFV